MKSSRSLIGYHSAETRYKHMEYYQIERVVARYQNEEGQAYTKTRCFYGKTKEEAEYKYHEYLKASSNDGTLPMFDPQVSHL